MGVGVAIVLAFIVSFATTADGGEQRDRQDHRHFYKHNDKFDYPQKNRWSQFPITRYRVMKELGLTEDQWGDIKNLRENLKEEMRKIRTQHKEDMMGVLTPAQRDTLEIRINEINKFKREHRIYHRDMRREGHREDRPQKYGPWQRSRKDRGTPFFDEIDYVEPAGSQFFGVAPLYNDIASKIAIINKPIAYSGEKTTWGKLKNMYR